MKLRTLFFIFVLLIFATLLGYNYYYQPFSTSNNQENQIGSDNPLNDELLNDDTYINSNNDGNLSPIDSSSSDTNTSTTSSNRYNNTATTFFRSNLESEYILGELAMLTEPSAKIARLMLAPVTITPDLPIELFEELQDLRPGGVTVFGSDISLQQASGFISQLHTMVDDSLLIAVDHEGGTVQRLSGEGFTQLPSWQAQCRIPLDEAQRIWDLSARQLASLGVHIVLAPMVDFASNNKVLGSRICSSDPDQVVAYGLGWYQAFLQSGIQPVFKHFPGIGQATKDLHFAFDAISVTPQEAQVYTSLIETVPHALLSVMVSHVGVENQFASVPCSLSRTCVQELAALAPDALLVTDALEMASARVGGRTLTRTVQEAILAGNHVLVFGPDVTLVQLIQVVENSGKRYQTDLEFRLAVDKAVHRVLRLEYSFEEYQ